MKKNYSDDYQGQWTQKMSQNFEDDLRCWPNVDSPKIITILINKTEEIRLFVPAQCTFMILKQ